MRINIRTNTPVWLIALLPILSIGVAFIIGAFFILWAGESPFKAYAALIKGSLGSTFAITESLARATPLIFTGLAAAVAFRAKFWNIGAEGQLYFGAMAATLVGTGVIDLPAPIMIPMLFIAGAVAGCLILLVPVILKTHMKVDEVVTTLLLNFVILLFVNMLLEGPWKDPMAMGWPQAARIIDNGVLPTIVAKSRLHLGIIVAL
jgi:simple sugar transport system permease protein